VAYGKRKSSRHGQGSPSLFDGLFGCLLSDFFVISERGHNSHVDLVVRSGGTARGGFFHRAGIESGLLSSIALETRASARVGVGGADAVVRHPAQVAYFASSGDSKCD